MPNKDGGKKQEGGNELENQSTAPSAFCSWSNKAPIPDLICQLLTVDSCKISSFMNVVSVVF